MAEHDAVLRLLQPMSAAQLEVLKASMGESWTHALQGLVTDNPQTRHADAEIVRHLQTLNGDQLQTLRQQLAILYQAQFGTGAGVQAPRGVDAPRDNRSIVERHVAAGAAKADPEALAAALVAEGFWERPRQPTGWSVRTPSGVELPARVFINNASTRFANEHALLVQLQPKDPNSWVLVRQSALAGGSSSGFLDGKTTMQFDASSDHPAAAKLAEGGRLQFRLVFPGEGIPAVLELASPPPATAGAATAGPAAPPAKAERLPFNGNAAKQWLPAMDAAREYVKGLGYAGLEYEGSGILARSVEVSVNAIELQTIFLVTSDGRRVELGKVLPEGAHLRELKSTAELTEEIIGLFRSYHRDGSRR